MTNNPQVRPPRILLPRHQEDAEAGKDSTRTRLLLAAGEAFAQHGFHAATVGMICKAAGANIAAVNYHFGSKERLYEETIKFGRKSCCHSQLLESDALGQMEPRAALRAFIEAYIRTLLGDESLQWHTKIICRELTEPTPALDSFIRDVVKLRRQRLSSIINRLVEKPLSPQQLERIGESLIAQGQFYYRCGPIVLRLRGKESFDAGDMQDIVDHITLFSLGGIRAIAAQESGTDRHNSVPGASGLKPLRGSRDALVKRGHRKSVGASE